MGSLRGTRLDPHPKSQVRGAALWGPRHAGGPPVPPRRPAFQRLRAGLAHARGPARRGAGWTLRAAVPRPVTHSLSQLLPDQRPRLHQTHGSPKQSGARSLPGGPGMGRHRSRSSSSLCSGGPAGGGHWRSCGQWGPHREGGPSVRLSRFPHSQSRLRPAFRLQWLTWAGRRPVLRPSPPAPPPWRPSSTLESPLGSGHPAWASPPAPRVQPPVRAPVSTGCCPGVGLRPG